MIRGVGIDLIETERVARLLERHGERFEARVYTPLERDQCRDRRDRVQALAARFAAKEACLKALGTGWAEGIGLSDVEVVRASNGRPEIRLHGAAAERARELGVTATHVSLTHQPLAAAAMVILEGSEG